MAAVSAGSVTGYRYFTNKNENINIKEIASDPSEDQPIPLTDENAEYETSSLFQLSKSENALTTQEIYEKVLPSVVGVTSTFTYTFYFSISFAISRILSSLASRTATLFSRSFICLSFASFSSCRFFAIIS